MGLGLLEAWMLGSFALNPCQLPGSRLPSGDISRDIHVHCNIHYKFSHNTKGDSILENLREKVENPPNHAYPRLVIVL